MVQVVAGFIHAPEVIFRAAGSSACVGTFVLLLWSYPPKGCPGVHPVVVGKGVVWPPRTSNSGEM